MNRQLLTCSLEGKSLKLDEGADVQSGVQYRTQGGFSIARRGARLLYCRERACYLSHFIF